MIPMTTSSSINVNPARFFLVIATSFQPPVQKRPDWIERQLRAIAVDRLQWPEHKMWPRIKYHAPRRAAMDLCDQKVDIHDLSAS